MSSACRWRVRWHWVLAQHGGGEAGAPLALAVLLEAEREVGCGQNVVEEGCKEGTVQARDAERVALSYA